MIALVCMFVCPRGFRMSRRMTKLNGQRSLLIPLLICSKVFVSRFNKRGNAEMLLLQNSQLFMSRAKLHTYILRENPPSEITSFPQQMSTRLKQFYNWGLHLFTAKALQGKKSSHSRIKILCKKWHYSWLRDKHIFCNLFLLWFFGLPLTFLRDWFVYEQTV